MAGEIAARGWFFSASGNVQDTDLDTLSFDSIKGQPEVRAGLTLGGRHHLRASYLRIRREEQGTATGTILGVVRFRDDISVNIAVDDVRAGYGYDLFQSEWIDGGPFLEIAYLKERTVVTNRTLGIESPQRDSGVFPLPGFDLALFPGAIAHPRFRIEGMATGRGHLFDLVVGVEGVLGPAFAGAGFRHVAFSVENGSGRDQADVRLNGFYAEGGVRF